MADDYIKLSMRYRADFVMVGASDEAELTFVRGLSYCGLNDTRGVIAYGALDDLLPRRSRGTKARQTIVAELTGAGRFWEPCPLGWVVRSWDKWQSELNHIQEKREKDAERKRKQRAADRASAVLGLPPDPGEDY